MDAIRQAAHQGSLHEPGNCNAFHQDVQSQREQKKIKIVEQQQSEDYQDSSRLVGRSTGGQRQNLCRADAENGEKRTKCTWFKRDIS